ncbi:hypothetical protein MJM99_32355, partial [Salmonella enterica subsp. enterica serovar Kentucky]|nr:hypothetical protein [Salmonella enterica subsp. enterica serovar Kentucky]
VVANVRVDGAQRFQTRQFPGQFFIRLATRVINQRSGGLFNLRAAFMTVTPYSVGEAYAVGANWLGGANIISGIIIGLVVAEMFT